MGLDTERTRWLSVQVVLRIDLVSLEAYCEPEKNTLYLSTDFCVVVWDFEYFLKKFHPFERNTIQLGVRFLIERFDFRASLLPVRCIRVFKRF